MENKAPTPLIQIEEINQKLQNAKSIPLTSLLTPNTYFDFNFIKFYLQKSWGLGIGDWGLGIGDWGLGPIPNPPSPIPNPQSPIPN